MPEIRLTTIFHPFRHSWRALVLTDLAYKLIAFVVLTPLAAVLFRVLIAVSGRPMLADRVILFFFLGPAGWVFILAVGSLWVGMLHSSRPPCKASYARLLPNGVWIY